MSYPYPTDADIFVEKTTDKLYTYNAAGFVKIQKLVTNNPDCQVTYSIGSLTTIPTSSGMASTVTAD